VFVPRTLAELDRGPQRGALLRALLVGAILAAVLTALLTVNIVPGQVSLGVGDIATEEIRAPTGVSYISEVETQEALDAAAASVEPQYRDIEPPDDIRQAQLSRFDRVATRLQVVLDRRDAGVLREEPPEAIEAELRELDAGLANQLGEEQIDLIADLTRVQWTSVTEAGRSVLERTLSGEVLSDELPAVRQTVRNRITNALSQPLRELAGDLAAHYVAPNRELDQVATEAAREAAREQVPSVSVDVRQGSVVVREGEELTARDVEKLEQLGLTEPREAMGALAGNALLSVLLSTLLISFLWRVQPEIWYRNRSLLLFLLALLVTATAVRIAADGTLWAFVVPTSATVMLTGILLGGYAGAAMAVSLALITGLANQGSIEPALYVLSGGIVALLSIVRAERLNVFVRAGGLLTLSNLVVLGAFALLDGRDLGLVIQQALAAVVHAALAVIGAVGSFAVLGNLFGIMTVFQLLELANPSSRLLRRLLLETPGTYHHSVMVGNLAERAAETIGADPLLARVAAYYHDIGKMKNPLAFIENQAGSHNIHDDLNAETSARIIAAHIRDGIDLAYEHRLPVQITGFIPQHHGTSVMSFFHSKAIREVGGNGELVDENRFRYPGPKPQSREAAILMLADGVEASVRSLDDKDEASIREMVNRIVDGRLEDGQLDDADLTLKHISLIKEAFVQQLLGMYHSRIKYPDNVVPIERHEQQA
jgi:cyclic-di-AMP phosphodiesterase PgpH